ncbi:hypothetical protein ACTORR_19795 [Pseudomonas sp. SAR267]|uniref:hypothetical protein n=1 Tax=Pseudomonas TaxID=286 RepID=UPI001AAF897A|nr:hypothetical protein [Pseudomonas asiatica]MBO2925107.1 hypothetical protein [Pseudomonas asiatica]
MAKFIFTVEDTDSGVSVCIEGQGTQSVLSTKAGIVARGMVQQAKLIGRIDAPIAFAAFLNNCDCDVGCPCEVCEAVREKYTTKPTIH